MNYAALLEEARREADIDAVNLHPPGPRRAEFRRWLVVKKYLEYISPVTVEEALVPPETCS